jgi:hypothetical protein
LYLLQNPVHFLRSTLRAYEVMTTCFFAIQSDCLVFEADTAFTACLLTSCFLSGLQIRLKDVHREASGQVSVCESWRAALLRALEALDLTLLPSMFAFVFHLEKVLHAFGHTRAAGEVSLRALDPGICILVELIAILFAEQTNF